MVLETVLPGLAFLAGFEPVELKIRQLGKGKFRRDAVMKLQKFQISRLRGKVFRQGLNPGTVFQNLALITVAAKRWMLIAAAFRHNLEQRFILFPCLATRRLEALV